MEKSPEAFRTIREVADAMDLPQHVLRFWETRFPQIRPLKRAGGRRYYRPEDVERLRRIKRLLYDEGYTIKGVQKLFKEQGAQAMASAAFDPQPAFDAAGAEERPAAGRRGAGAVEGAGDEGAPETPAWARGGISAEDLAALHESLEHIRQAQRILMQARTPEA